MEYIRGWGRIQGGEQCWELFWGVEAGVLRTEGGWEYHVYSRIDRGKCTKVRSSHGGIKRCLICDPFFATVHNSFSNFVLVHVKENPTLHDTERDLATQIGNRTTTSSPH
jgi:hypothetical protein